MSYEEIDKTVYENDVFTNGAEGRYSKPKATTEKKKRAPKIPTATTDETTEQPTENGHTEEGVKTKKKSRKTHNEEESSEIVPSADGETVVKPKKKRAPKIESNDENLNPLPTTEEEPVKKKKSKTSKSTPIEDDSQLIDNSTTNELEPTTTTATKVKKSKKHKTPKTTTDPSNDMQTNEFNEYTTNNSEFNDIYGSNAGDISNNIPSSYPTEGEQFTPEPEKSEYEAAICNAYSALGSKMNFSEFLGNDQWCILHPPKSARTEPRSRIRKILPGGGGNGNSDKPDGKSSNGKSTNQKSGFFSRIRSGVNTLVRDENNLLFGERSNYDIGYYDEEEDGIDTDDLHRYAQKLRELEDTDREVNPEFLVLRDGKTVYAVHEADAEGKMTLSTRKPIYDRDVDQGPGNEPTEKKNLLSRLKNPFSRNKDKDSKDGGSPKLSTGTPDSGRKHDRKKASNKTVDDDITNNGH